MNPGERERASISGMEILTHISRGGMGDVLLARKVGAHGFEKLIALKVIRGELTRRDDIRSMFLDEARLVARLNHPSIAHVYDFGEEGGLLFLAMEYVPGVALSKLLSKGLAPFPVSVAVRLAAEACRGLHAAHELLNLEGQHLGVVHRDVTPHNLMITYSGHLKILDFGIALINDRQAPDTEVGTIKGKPSYMSPEQLRSEPIDRRTDVYTIGVVLHEILTGQKLFKKQNLIQMAKAIETGTIAPPSQINPQVPAALDQIVLTAMAKKASQRYPDARVMAMALEECGKAIEGPTLEEFAEGALVEERKAHTEMLRSLRARLGEPSRVDNPGISEQKTMSLPPDLADELRGSSPDPAPETQRLGPEAARAILAGHGEAIASDSTERMDPEEAELLLASGKLFDILEPSIASDRTERLDPDEAIKLLTRDGIFGAPSPNLALDATVQMDPDEAKKLLSAGSIFGAPSPNLALDATVQMDPEEAQQILAARAERAAQVSEEPLLADRAGLTVPDQTERMTPDEAAAMLEKRRSRTELKNEPARQSGPPPPADQVETVEQDGQVEPRAPAVERAPPAPARVQSPKTADVRPPRAPSRAPDPQTAAPAAPRGFAERPPPAPPSKGDRAALGGGTLGPKRPERAPSDSGTDATLAQRPRSLPASARTERAEIKAVDVPFVSQDQTVLRRPSATAPLSGAPARTASASEPFAPRAKVAPHQVAADEETLEAAPEETPGAVPKEAMEDPAASAHPIANVPSGRLPWGFLIAGLLALALALGVVVYARSRAAQNAPETTVRSP